MTFASWAACTAAANAFTSVAASRGLSGRFASMPSSEPPPQYSRAMNGLPSCSPISKTCTMPGCSKRAMACASVLKRSISASPECAPDRIIFNAQGRSRASDLAL